MEAYILDSLYRRQTVVDKFISFVWAERFRAYGDFELLLHSTTENRSRFPVGTKITHNETYRVATVETVEDVTDDEGRALLKLTGPSLESILDNRLARGTLGDLTATPKWIVSGLPAAIARQIFHDICVTGILDSGDVIPLINEGSSVFPPDTISEPTDTVDYEMDMMSVYKAIKDICEVYDMGFRLIRGLDTSQLYFDVYMGSDRTTSQTTLPAVVFSTALGNLKNTTELTTIALHKNVCYVVSPVGNEVVYAQDVDPTVEGFERRAMFIKADDITDPTPSVASAKMIQRGTEELAKNRRLSAFDGENTQRSSYKYGVDYNLGDLCEIQNSSGSASIVQITEQIFVSDKEGERSYPTLSLNRFITPGSWDEWTPDEVWDNVSPTLYWDDAS